MRNRSAFSRLKTWWLAKPDVEQTKTLAKGLVATVCLGSAATFLPLIGQEASVQRAEAEFRSEAEFLAARIETRAPVRSSDEAAVLKNPWMRSVEYALERSPVSPYDKFGQRFRDMAALDGVATFSPRHFKLAERSEAEHLCLSQAIFYEARSESIAGQLAVAEVIMNRVGDHRYPNTVCNVVFQGSERSTGCQFTFTCDGALRRQPSGKMWKRAQDVAANVLMELNRPLTGSATHYHTNYVNPIWNQNLVETKVIGTHIFYRFPRGREWNDLRAQNADRST